MNHNTDNLSLGNEHSVALNAQHAHYGSAVGVDAARLRTPVVIAPAGLADRAKFLLGELSGLLFILLSTVYILAVPVWITRQGGLIAAIGRGMKRTLDILGATVGLLLSIPFFLVLPILIKLDSRGPVFYTQARVGVNRRKNDRRMCQKTGAENRRDADRRHEDFFGKPFTMIKFRTMVQDAEKVSGPVWASKNDPRITRFGRFMRKARLDEIPQFISVLKGDMSLVGPRPERPSFVRELATKIDEYPHRLMVKPGLTGLAQVENGYDTSLASVAEKVRFDLHYIRTWSVVSDIRILMRTVVVVFTGRGAC